MWLHSWRIKCTVFVGLIFVAALNLTMLIKLHLGQQFYGRFIFSIEDRSRLYRVYVNRNRREQTRNKHSGVGSEFKEPFYMQKENKLFTLKLKDVPLSKIDSTKQLLFKPTNQTTENYYKPNLQHARYTMKETPLTPHPNVTDSITLSYLSESIERLKAQKHRDGHSQVNATKLTNTVMQKWCNGAVMDIWYDVCINYTTWNIRWHPLFPEIPQKTVKTQQLGDSKIATGNLVRRIYGYFIVEKSGKYEFQLNSYEGAEALISDTSMTKNNFTDELSADNRKTLLYINLTYYQMVEQNVFKAKYFTMARGNLETLFLDNEKVYFVEIFQGGRFYSQYELKWRMQDKKSKFKVIGSPNLFHTINTLRKKTPSKLWHIKPNVQKYHLSIAEQNRLNYHKLKVLDTQSTLVKNFNLSCPNTNWFKINITEIYSGIFFVNRQLVYPKNHFDYTGGWPENHLLLNKVEANKIVSKVFDKLNIIHNRSLRLEKIVHVQVNLQNDFQRYSHWQDSHYFIEIDVMKNNQLFRSSNFVHMQPNDEVCFMLDYLWNNKATINILTPIRNQIPWFEYLLKMLQEILRISNENNVNLIVIDYNSTDGDIPSMLKEFNIKHQYIRANDASFNKVRALNIGLNHVVDNDSIVFIMDLHLQLPYNIFDRIRKFSIQDKTAFCPILLKLQCGQHEQYTALEESLWIDDGYGMMAMYKSDWIKVGGFNEKRFGQQWGGEDWELVDRIVGHGLYLIHDRMPRFYHIYHNNEKTWDGNHI